MRKVKEPAQQQHAFKIGGRQSGGIWFLPTKFFQPQQYLLHNMCPDVTPKQLWESIPQSTHGRRWLAIRQSSWPSAILDLGIVEHDAF